MLCTSCMSATFDTTWQHYIELIPGPFDSVSIIYLLPSRKARQLILMPKSPSVCILCIFFSLYVYMSVTVSYGHLARGLKIVSVAIPMASSCSIYIYKVSNS